MNDEVKGVVKEEKFACIYTLFMFGECRFTALNVGEILLKLIKIENHLLSFREHCEIYQTYTEYYVHTLNTWDTTLIIKYLRHDPPFWLRFCVRTYIVHCQSFMF